MSEEKPLEQVAFEAYRDAVGGTRPWSDVREPEREVWKAVAQSIAAKVAPGSALTGDGGE